MHWVGYYRRTLVSAFVFATAVILAAGVVAPADATDGVVTITGTVRFADGTPVEGLRVAYGHGHTTEADGGFTITTTQDAIDGHKGRLVVRTPLTSSIEGVPSRLRLVWPQAVIDTTRLLEITLPPFVEQRFEVRDATGKPAVRWGVSGTSVWDPAPPAGYASGLGAARVLQRVPIVHDNDVTMVVADPDYSKLHYSGELDQRERLGSATLPGSASVALGDRAVLPLLLPEAAKVRGVVQDASGSPLHAIVQLLPFNPFQGGFFFNTTDAAGLFRLRTSQDLDASVSFDGREPLVPIEGEGTLVWSGNARVHIPRTTSLTFSMSEVVRQVVRVRQGDERMAGVRLHGVQQRVTGSVLTGRGGAIDAQAWFYGTTGGDGSVRLPVFEDSPASPFIAEMVRDRPTYDWSVYRRVTDFTPGSDVLRVRIPTVSKLTGSYDLPPSWYARMTSRSLTDADHRLVEASSDTGHDLHLGFDPRGSQITFEAETSGQRAPKQLFAETEVSGPSSRSHFTAPRANAELRVRAVNYQGDPVAGVLVRTPSYFDRAIPQQLFDQLDKSKLWQMLSDRTGQRGRVQLPAYRDRAMDLDIVVPSGHSLRINDFALLDDRKLLVVINRSGVPVIK